MTGLSISARNPLCLSCIRQLVADDLSKSWFPFHRQVRGKKKTKRITTINVRLLEDVTGYGKKGSITPVEPGRMRNTWYPQQKAEYVTASKLQGLKPQKLEAVRDFTFGMGKPEAEPVPASTQAETVPPTLTVTRLLPPLRATEIMEAALPSHITFYRSPITDPEPEVPESPTPKRAASPAAAVLEAASEPLKPPESRLTTIYGSVSTADVVDSMKAMLSQTEEGARVVLAPEDLKILVPENVEPQVVGIEGDRLKALGEFQVEARVKGGEAVVRTVSVRAQSEGTIPVAIRKAFDE